MIEAASGANPALLAVFAFLLLIAALLSRTVARRSGRPFLPLLGAGASAALVLAVTLTPVHSGAPAARVCTLQQDSVGAVLATQGLLNIALFAPLGLFATLATRRPVSVLAGSFLLSGGIEVAQALVPGTGRLCDSADWQSNVLGAAMGCLAGALLARGRQRTETGRTPLMTGRDVRRGALLAVVGACGLAAVATPTLALTVAEANLGHRASPEQTAAATKAVREFFGDGAEPTRIGYSPGRNSGPGRVEVGTAQGGLTLEWPSGQVTEGQLRAVSVEPAKGQRHADARYLRMATAFARTHFPWALRDSRSTVHPAGGPDSQAKAVQWRTRVDGVLMPMRLDVVLGGDGAVLSFSARATASPELPRATVTREAAHATALGTHPGGRVTSSELVARQDEAGRWRPCWMVAFEMPGDAPSSGTGTGGPGTGGSGTGGPESRMRGVILDGITGKPLPPPSALGR
ncbi:VanZ family protein [Streptomyces sp. JNUCC 64]